MLLDYIFNNQLWIDKSTYISVVIGQISIYGIMLTFYQFIASFSKDMEVVYLGHSLKEYLVYKYVRAQKIIASKWFMLLFVLEVLYKPLLNVYENKIYTICTQGNKLISCMNFLWYAYVVVFFLIFMIMFFQCTKCIFVFRSTLYRNGNQWVAREINKQILTELSKTGPKRKDIDSLCEVISGVDKNIKGDKDISYLEIYNELIWDIFNWYIEKKGKDEGNAMQTCWKYNMSHEVTLIRGIVNGELFCNKIKIIEHMDRYVFKLIELNLREAKLAGYDDIDMFGLTYAYAESQKKINLKEWGEILDILFERGTEKQKQRIVEYLCKYNDKNSLCEKLYEYSWKNMIGKAVREVFETGKQDKIVSFLNVIHEPNQNQWLTERLIDYLMSYVDYDTSKIIEMLNCDNRTYLFAYMVLYYSIYAEKTGKKRINVKMFKSLLEETDLEKIDDDTLFARIKDSNIGHRFYDEMLSDLLSCFRQKTSAGFLSEIHNKKLLNVFIIFVIKICVCNQRYIDWECEEDTTKVYILNNLSKNEELLGNDLIQQQIYDMQYNYFMNIKELPEEFEINLRNLLLADVNEKVLLKDGATIWRNKRSIGEYALIKYDRQSTQGKEIQKLIREAYVSYNESIEEYIKYLERECERCGRPLGFVQSEQMKKYLRSML